MSVPEPLRTSIGVWAFGTNATRFLPSGYHPEVTNEAIVERTRRIADGLAGLLDGVEFHYPGEVDETSIDSILDVLRSYGMGIPVIASGLHPDPAFALGSLVNPNPQLRKHAVATNIRGVDLAARIGAKFIIWPGAEGYNYPFQRPYADMWEHLIDGIAEITAHAAGKGVIVLLEHKNSEPAMKILMRNIGMTLFVIEKVAKRGVDTTRLLVNMDWQHLIMNGEELAEYASLLASEGRLGHQHANDGWGTFDDDNVVGTNFFMQTLELAAALQDLAYGAKGELLGFDLYPYTENQIEAARRAILHWEFLWDLAGKIDRKDLSEARRNADAMAAQRTVYSALGLSPAFETMLLKRRQDRNQPNVDNH